MARIFKTEYQPLTGGTTEQEIKWFPAFFSLRAMGAL